MIKLSLSAFLVVGGLGFSAWAQNSQPDDQDLERILEGSKGSEQVVSKSPLRKIFSQPTAEQNIFLNYIDKGDMEKALFQWAPAFSRGEFAKTENGRALRALLLFQNGLQLTGLEQLLSIANPEAINTNLIQIWRQVAREDHPVWNQIWIEKWHHGWTKVFGVNLEIRVASKTLNGFKDIEKIKVLLSQSKPGTFERNLLQWQLVLGLSTQDTGKAAQALAHLMKQEKLPVGKDLMDITAARMLYQNGFLDAAIKYYEKVPKASDYWLESQEEMAWSYMRKGQAQDAIAITQILNEPSLVWLSGPEASFLRSLAQLKVCDYRGVVQTLNFFKDSFKPRTASLLKISKDANTPEVAELIDLRAKGELNYGKMGPIVKQLPRWALRDVYMGYLAKFHSGLSKESEKAGQLYTRSLSQGSDRVGFQADTERIKQSVAQRAAGVKAALISRVQTLAKEEVEETQNILSKLQIVEAEMLQQSSMVDRLAKNSKKGAPTELKGRKTVAKYQIEFPGSDEVWFDELSNYNVDLKGGCEAKTQTK